jgi:hypothetical protein
MSVFSKCYALPGWKATPFGRVLKSFRKDTLRDDPRFQDLLLRMNLAP